MHLSTRNVSLRDVVVQLNFEGIAKIIGSRNKNFFLFDLENSFKCHCIIA